MIQMGGIFGEHKGVILGERLSTPECTFCPRCGFRLSPIDVAEYRRAARGKRPTNVHRSLRDQAMLVEGRAKVGWIKNFKEPPRMARPSEIAIPASRPQTPPAARMTAPMPTMCESGLRPSKRRGESRKSPRFPIQVVAGFATEREFHSGALENLSSGGLFVATLQPVGKGEIIEVTFSMPGLQRNVTAIYQVRWSREPGAATQDVGPGMGLRFIQMSAETRAAVELFIRHRVKSGS